MNPTLILGECLEVMADAPDASVLKAYGSNTRG